MHRRNVDVHVRRWAGKREKEREPQESLSARRVRGVLCTADKISLHMDGTNPVCFDTLKWCRPWWNDTLNERQQTDRRPAAQMSHRPAETGRCCLIQEKKRKAANLTHSAQFMESGAPEEEPAGAHNAQRPLYCPFICTTLYLLVLFSSTRMTWPWHDSAPGPTQGSASSPPGWSRAARPSGPWGG